MILIGLDYVLELFKDYNWIILDPYILLVLYLMDVECGLYEICIFVYQKFYCVWGD